MGKALTIWQKTSTTTWSCCESPELWYSPDLFKAEVVFQKDSGDTGNFSTTFIPDADMVSSFAFLYCQVVDKVAMYLICCTVRFCLSE